MERMPVLEELIASGGSKEDLVVLHINHCMDNSFYFNRQLEKTGARVIFVAAPYNDRRAGCEGERRSATARRKWRTVFGLYASREARTDTKAGRNVCRKRSLQALCGP